MQNSWQYKAAINSTCHLIRQYLELKSVGPKLVPFFKTVAIFFVLFGQEERTSVFFCVAKCLPVLSLVAFVLLHGMSLDECYRYSRRILTGLIFSVLGDIFLVWKHSFCNFELGLLSFAIAQTMYARAFGWRPLKPRSGLVFLTIGVLVYSYLQQYLSGMMVFLAPLYMTLICTMAWRAVARVEIYDDLWTWTKLCGCVGAVCFMISDLVIAINMFAVAVPGAHQIIMLTYYAAQFGISLSVVDSQADELIRVQNDQ
ncbi:lysoplasmalogenase-like protein TMEM86A [Elysia marginata]|uniref:lysoplasmalogenase n=1 Tax=Elysia marginata TaxID=1093978 RepID=A0AAV4FK40_9GAST|nr:lysoplasmalogenase-like protein TMEM86A [Elysia marginata]